MIHGRCCCFHGNLYTIFASWATCPWAFGGSESDDKPTQRWLLHSISLIRVIPENHQPAAAQVAIPNYIGPPPPGRMAIIIYILLAPHHPWLSEIP